MSDEPGRQDTGESGIADPAGEPSAAQAAAEPTPTDPTFDARAAPPADPVADPAERSGEGSLGDAPDSDPAEGGPASEPGATEPTASDPGAEESSATDSDTNRPDSTEQQAESKAVKRRRKTHHPGLARAFRTGRPVEGTIVQVIKGGYEVKVGKSRGFCPHSQVGLHREEQPERQIGEKYLFRITQLRRGGEDVVLSRRALLEEKRIEEAKAVRATLLEGAVMQGHVVGTADFGAFVDLGAGVQGLVHISELAHQRVGNVEEAVKVGDLVRVRILKLNEETGRISLSVRQAEADPWSEVGVKFQVGQSYQGTVRRLADFGAFVELATGIEALAPAVEFPPSPGGWNEGLEPGVERQWQVLSVNEASRRISVTLPGEGEASTGKLVAGIDLEGKVQRIERYGVFVWLRPGSVGLLPRAWTGAGEAADLRRHFHVGDPVQVSVVEVSEGGRRIRLAKKGVKVDLKADRRDSPRGRHEAEAQQPAEEQGAFGTSLADKLKAALGRIEND